MSDIFLSYKSEDRAKAQIIAKALESHGYSVWWDRIILPGQTFEDVIENELSAANCIVVLWSKESVKSNWVRTEASEGKMRKILIPVLIEDVIPPLAFRHMNAAKLMDWNGTSPHHEFDRLIQSVGGKLGRAAPMHSREPEQEKERTEDKTVTNTIDMKFALIPKGEFMMGSEEYDWEKPVHTVTISKPFYLSVYQLTQREWETVMGNNPSDFKGDNQPVENVSWDDVQEFIKKLNEKENTHKYRLPSEAEWEYAVRARTTTRYSFGDGDSKLDEYAWYSENSDKTHPVGKKKANQWGLYDMHGNVWEWVQDEWHGNYDSAPTDGSAWEDGVSADRVLRGGGWVADAGDCRSADRDFGPGNRSRFLGFRLLQEM